MDFSINHQQLKRTCLLTEREWKKLYKGKLLGESASEHHIFIDNGASILAVAHLDTVRDDTHYCRVVTKTNDLVYNACLDDRLGAYLILYKLPELLGGKAFDILLTFNEESMMSTGFWFEPPRQYNWMFQFDRRGNDVVLYQYGTSELRAALVKTGFTIGVGSYSDIADMDGVGACGINFGCGYENAHAELSYADLHITKRQVRRFVAFYQANKRTHYKLNAPGTSTRRRHTTTYTYYTGGKGAIVPYATDTVSGYRGKHDNQGWGECQICSEYGALDEDGFCRWCTKYYHVETPATKTDVDDAVDIVDGVLVTDELEDDDTHVCENCEASSATLYIRAFGCYLCRECIKAFVAEHILDEGVIAETDSETFSDEEVWDGASDSVGSGVLP
jgi:hypothetical protein